MNGVNKFLKLLPLRLEQETGLLVPPGGVNVDHFSRVLVRRERRQDSDTSRDSVRQPKRR